MSEPTKSTLSVDKYTIELSDGPSHIYKLDNESNKIWVAAASDPDTAMQIIEGLILVEHKRFYYPESKPNITTEVHGTGPKTPPFLKRS